MHIEGVIICVGYADFLAHTLPQNKQHFNKLVVVTDLKDEDTKRVCIYHHVQCVQTDAFYEDGDTLNKGRGINEGLKHLSKDGWVIQLDADIYLPPLTRQILDKTPLDERCLYGMDRLMCPSFEAWMEYINSPKLIHNAYIYVHNHFPVGVRIVSYLDEGYFPIGFFQMWHPRHSGVHEYPPHHGSVDRSDLLHAKKFTRDKRRMLPELYCIHLESEGLHEKQMGANWKGRKTRRFGFGESGTDGDDFVFGRIKNELKVAKEKLDAAGKKIWADSDEALGSADDIFKEMDVRHKRHHRKHHHHHGGYHENCWRRFLCCIKHWFDK